MPSDIGFAPHVATRGGASSHTGIPATASPGSDDERTHARAWMREMERAQIDTWFLAPLPDRKASTKPPPNLADFPVENAQPPLPLPRAAGRDSEDVSKELRVAPLPPAHDRAEQTDALSGANNDRDAQYEDHQIAADRASGNPDVRSSPREPRPQDGSPSKQSQIVDEQPMTEQPPDPIYQSDVHVLAPTDANAVLEPARQEKGTVAMAGGIAVALSSVWSSQMAPISLDTQHWPAMPLSVAMNAPAIFGAGAQGRLEILVQKTSALAPNSVPTFQNDNQYVDEQGQEAKSVQNSGNSNSIQSVIDALRSQNDIGVHIEKSSEGHAIWLSVPSDIDDAGQHLQYIVRAMTKSFADRGERVWQVVCNGTKVWAQDRWTEGFHIFSATRARPGLADRTRIDAFHLNSIEEN